MSDAASIVAALGGRWRGNGGMVRCPCHDDTSPSLSIRDGDETGRIIVTCFAGCDRSDIIAELRRMGVLETPERVTQLVSPRPRSAPDHKPDPDATAIWKGGQVAHPDSVVARYLQGRGITDPVPPSIRAGNSLQAGRIQMPTMIAAVQSPAGEIIAVQSTLLTPSGKRAPVSVPRITQGALGYGAARFAKATDVLGLAEGTEDALSAMQLTGVPCWASLGAARMPRVCIPEHVRELHVFADNDDAGRAAAERTAAAHRSRRVVLRFPPIAFKDWNDALRAKDISAQVGQKLGRPESVVAA
jgi:DNA primase